MKWVKEEASIQGVLSGKKTARVEGSAQAKVWKLDCLGSFRSRHIGRQDGSVREETVVGGASMSTHTST